MFQKEFIEPASVHVISVVLRQAELGNFAEADHVLPVVRPMRPDRPMFVDEFFLFHDGQETDLVKNSRCGAEQRFADMWTRVDRLVHNQMIDAGAGQISAECRSGRTAANNDDLGVHRWRGWGEGMNREQLRRVGGWRSGVSSQRRRLMSGDRIGFLRWSIASLFLFRSARAVAAARGGPHRGEDAVARGVACEMEQFQDVAAEAKEFRTVSLARSIQRDNDGSFDLAG